MWREERGELGDEDFPSFSEGLSLRGQEAPYLVATIFGDFPSFSEGLSLREEGIPMGYSIHCISLPFRRDFH